MLVFNHQKGKNRSSIKIYKMKIGRVLSTFMIWKVLPAQYSPPPSTATTISVNAPKYYTKVYCTLRVPTIEIVLTPTSPHQPTPTTYSRYVASSPTPSLLATTQTVAAPKTLVLKRGIIVENGNYGEIIILAAPNASIPLCIGRTSSCQVF